MLRSLSRFRAHAAVWFAANRRRFPSQTSGAGHGGEIRFTRTVRFEPIKTVRFEQKNSIHRETISRETVSSQNIDSGPAFPHAGAQGMRRESVRRTASIAAARDTASSAVFRELRALL